MTLNSTRAAFARPGPGAAPFPDVKARTQPSDSLAPVDRDSGLPLPSVYLDVDASSVPNHLRGTGRPRAHPQARGASETDDRLSAAPDFAEEERGPPRFLGCPLPACRGRTPRRVRSPLLPCCGVTAVACEWFETLGTRDGLIFVAAFPTAHTLARLRIAGRVTASAARLATGWVGSPFAGRGSHPLDNEPNFMKSSHLIPFGPDLPGRNQTP